MANRLLHIFAAAIHFRVSNREISLSLRMSFWNPFDEALPERVGASLHENSVQHALNTFLKIKAS